MEVKMATWPRFLSGEDSTAEQRLGSLARNKSKMAGLRVS